MESDRILGEALMFAIKVIVGEVKKLVSGQSKLQVDNGKVTYASGKASISYDFKDLNANEETENPEIIDLTVTNSH